MAIKIENNSSIEVKNLDRAVERALACLQAEHTRGLTRIRLVDRIEDPRLPKAQAESLPVLYRPKMPGAASASGEIALGVLFSPTEKALKRWAARRQAAAIIAQSIFSIVAQHYLVTYANRKLKSQNVERMLREYVDRHFKIWREQQNDWRSKLFRPLLPYFERWQRSLRRMQAEQAKKKS